MVEPAVVTPDPEVLHAVVFQDTLAMMTVAQLVKYNLFFHFFSAWAG